MVSKRYEFDEETVSKIHAIKSSKSIKTEKEVLVQAINNYLISEMIEHESVEFKTYQKMMSIENELKNLNNKMNHVDLGVSINNLFLASDFEINQHPKAIIDRDILNSEYYISAKKEITKLIREKDSSNRKENITREFVNPIKKEATHLEDVKPKNDVDDDWLNI